MTTIFSKPVALDAPYKVSTLDGGACVSRISENIAVVAWEMSTWFDETGGYQELYLAAIRHTPEGAEIGPTIVVPRDAISTTSGYYLNDIVQGREGEAWLVVEDQSADWTTYSHRFARVTVDPTTLDVSFEWKYSFRTRNRGQGGFVESWPEQNLLVIGTNNDDYNRVDTSADSTYIFTLHMDTGAISPRVQTPPHQPGSTSTARIFLEAMSLHKAAGKLLIVGDWYDNTVSRYHPGVWTTDIAPDGTIGSTWTYVGDLRGASGVSTYYFYTVRWAAATAVPDGWNVLFQSRYSSGRTYWFKIGLDGSMAWPNTYVTYNATSYHNRNYARGYDAVYDEVRDVSVATYMEWYVGVISHEAPGGDLAYSEQALPSSVNANNVYATQCCVVAPGNYVFICLSTGIRKPTSGDNAGTFGVVAWVGGQEEAMDLTASLGGQGQETQRAFRRMH